MKTLRTHFWSLFFSLFFVALLTAGIWYLAVTGAFLRNIGIGDFILMGLAIWRLTRLFTYDAITKFIRDWFVGAKSESFRGTLHTLVTCPWCTGLWFAATVVFFYFLTPFTWPVVLVLALAAVGSFFQLLSNLIGWHAEYKKVQTQQLQESHFENTGPTC